jgi:hypothetical protein
MILSLFLAHLGIGIAFTLMFVSREAGVKFFRFNAGLAAALVAIALAFFPREGGQAAVAGDAGGAFKALAAFEVALLFYWVTIGRAFTRYRTMILAVAVGLGAVALVAEAIAVGSGGSAPMRLLTVVSFVSSAALLGGACTAMILGHWYLVLPSLEIGHLQSIVIFHIVSMLVRILVVGAVVFAALSAWGAAPAGGVVNFRRYLTSVDGIFFWQRVLFGLAGPALLAYLTWETAKIRSTQSATGILYVDFFTVVVGEVLAKYLLVATRVPL